MESDILIKTVDLSRHYKVGEEEVIALDKVNLEIERNKICAILGTSGSGKSTLLNMLAGIERPSGGEVYIGKYRIDNLSEADLAKFRQKFTGFIFQSYNLMPTMTALENVALPLMFKGVGKEEREAKAMEMLGYKTDQGGFDKYRDKNAALFGNQIIQFFSDSQGNNPKYKYDENYNISESEFDFMKDTFTFCAKNQNSDSEGGNYSLTQENGNDESSTGSSSQPSNGGTQRFNVIGTLKKASNDSEAATAIYIDLDLAKHESIRLSNIRNYKLTYSSINVYCNDSKDVAAVKKEIQDKGYSCSTDDEGLQEQKKVMRVVQLILGAIGAVSMFVAAFGISNTMVMSVFERTKEIGIMKVLGCDIKDIKDMFLYEAGIIGLFGGTIGIIISYIISIIANLVAKKVMSGMIDTSMGAKICVSSIPLWLALLGIAFSVGVGVLAGLSPANKSIKVSSLTAIHNE